MSASTEHAVAEYFAAIRAMDVDRLMTAFASNAELYDPVGTPPKIGAEAIRDFFAQTFSSFQLVSLTENNVYIIGKIAAVKWTGRAVGPSGNSCDFEGIDVLHCTEQGLIELVRAFWDPTPVMALLQP
jgi:steroid delta-isomerase